MSDYVTMPVEPIRYAQHRILSDYKGIAQLKTTHFFNFADPLIYSVKSFVIEGDVPSETELKFGFVVHGDKTLYRILNSPIASLVPTQVNFDMDLDFIYRWILHKGNAITDHNNWTAVRMIAGIREKKLGIIICIKGSEDMTKTPKLTKIGFKVIKTV